MTDMLLHTLVWTGVLIALVLVLRRPVSRHFGPEAAYALWALPLFRLILPPLTLPAWMSPEAAAPATAPAPTDVLAAASPPSDAVIWQAATQAPSGAVPPPLAVPMEAATPAGFDLLAMLAAVPWLELVLFVWLAGAAVTVWLRFAAYFALRDELLADGREVGRARGRLGKVRLVETPATHAPLAMGVLDPVIALPPGFMALPDRPARDLALAHELAHHRGGDLLVNILVQPLFALHWWNPLGRYGWLALRRDQEAACDARVMACRQPHERAAYAALIARFAATPGGAVTNAALTAPMACPVLGEKSIIHRLRSLAMSDLSPRRRMAGRVLLGAGLLALPLTASISFAASDAVLEAPEPPEPPAPPEAPEAPEAPDAPDAPDAPKVMIIDTRTGEVMSDGDSAVTERVWRDADGKERRVKIVMRERPDAESLAKHLEGLEELEDLEGLKGLAAADRKAMLVELRAGLAEADAALADLPRVIALAHADAATARASAPRVMTIQGCRPGSSEAVETTEGKDGKIKVMICQSRVMASARQGLEEARAEIAKDKEIPEETRKTVLQTLDAQIARWKDKEG